MFAYRRTGVAQALPTSVYQAVAEMQLLLPPEVLMRLCKSVHPGSCCMKTSRSSCPRQLLRIQPLRLRL